MGLLPHTWEVASVLLQTLAGEIIHGHDLNHNFVPLNKPPKPVRCPSRAPPGPRHRLLEPLPRLHLFCLVPDWLLLTLSISLNKSPKIGPFCPTPTPDLPSAQSAGQEASPATVGEWKGEAKKAQGNMIWWKEQLLLPEYETHTLRYHLEWEWLMRPQDMFQLPQLSHNPLLKKRPWAALLILCPK